MAKFIVEVSDKRGLLNSLIYNMKKLITCNECIYYSDIEDADETEYRECKNFSNWSTAFYTLPTDFCSMGKEAKKDE